MILNKPNNKYIENAIDSLENNNQGFVKIIENKKVIESKYNTYISSFGGSIVQSGLVATCMIFEANSEKSKIIDLLINQYNDTITEKNDKIVKTNGFYFETFDKFSDDKITQLRNKLVEFAVALKLAMRCYEQVDNLKNKKNGTQ